MLEFGFVKNCPTLRAQKVTPSNRKKRVIYPAQISSFGWSKRIAIGLVIARRACTHILFLHHLVIYGKELSCPLTCSRYGIENAVSTPSIFSQMCTLSKLQHFISSQLVHNANLLFQRIWALPNAFLGYYTNKKIITSNCSPDSSLQKRNPQKHGFGISPNVDEIEGGTKHSGNDSFTLDKKKRKKKRNPQNTKELAKSVQVITFISNTTIYIVTETQTKPLNGEEKYDKGLYEA